MSNGQCVAFHRESEGILDFGFWIGDLRLM